MTAPRQILPGTTYLITRRCAGRQFLLRPSKLTNGVFLYVLSVAARRFGVQVHAYCVLSNHFHLVVTDPAARLPAFEQYLDSLVARALNAALGRWEAFWGPSSYSAVVLATPEAVVEKIAYVLANPVAAGLVHSGEQWPGLRSSAASIGGSQVTAPRPTTFFSSKGSMPAVAELTLAVPPGFDSAATLRRRVESAVDAAECAARRTGGGPRRFLGAARVLAQPLSGSAATVEPRRRLSPRVAARDRWKRIEALQRLRTFLSRYRAAWLARRRGDLGAVFPAGTYLMRIAHCAPCSAV